VGQGGLPGHARDLVDEPVGGVTCGGTSGDDRLEEVRSFSGSCEDLGLGVGDAEVRGEALSAFRQLCSARWLDSGRRSLLCRARVGGRRARRTRRSALTGTLFFSLYAPAFP